MAPFAVRIGILSMDLFVTFFPFIGVIAYAGTIIDERKDGYCYQIIQKSMDKLVIKAVPRYAEDKDKIAILLVNGFKKRFDDEYDIDINFLDYIENDGKNKVAVFISEITNEREG